MSVRIRLTRLGSKKRPFYRIIAVDSRAKRDGAYIERLGYYHPLNNPPTVFIEAEKTLKWLRDGAKPSETVLNLLRREGVWLRFRLEKRGLPASQIDQIMQEWFKEHHKTNLTSSIKPVEPAAESAPPTAQAMVEAPVSTDVASISDISPTDIKTVEPASPIISESINETAVTARTQVETEIDLATPAEPGEISQPNAS